MHFIEVRVTEVGGYTYNFIGGFESLETFKRFLREARADKGTAQVKILDCVCILGVDEQTLTQAENKDMNAADKILEQYYNDLMWKGRGRKEDFEFFFFWDGFDLEED